MGAPVLSIIFPPQINSPRKQPSSSLLARRHGSFRRLPNQLLFKKTPENIRLFSDKGETNEQTNFLDELSVGDQFIDKSQNKNSYSFDFVSSTIITLKGGFSIDRALPLSHAEHCTNLQVGEGF